MTALIRMFLLFVVVYVGIMFIRGLINGFIASDKKKTMNRFKDKNVENSKTNEVGEYIDYEEVKNEELRMKN